MFITTIFTITRKQMSLDVLKTCNTCQLTLDREPIANLNSHATKVQFGEMMSFTGATYRDMDEGLLKESKLIKDSCITKDHPSTGRSRVHCTACRHLNRVRMFFPILSVHLNLFQESWLLSSLPR